MITEKEHQETQEKIKNQITYWKTKSPYDVVLVSDMIDIFENFVIGEEAE